MSRHTACASNGKGRCHNLRGAPLAQPQAGRGLPAAYETVAEPGRGLPTPALNEELLTRLDNRTPDFQTKTAAQSGMIRRDSTLMSSFFGPLLYIGMVDTVAERMSARHHTASCRTTDWRRRVKPVKHHTVCSHGVNVWRLRQCIPRVSRITPAQIIGHNQDDVWAAKLISAPGRILHHNRCSVIAACASRQNQHSAKENTLIPHASRLFYPAIYFLTVFVRIMDLLFLLPCVASKMTSSSGPMSARPSIGTRHMGQGA